MTAVGDLVANLSLNSQGFSKGLQQSRSSLSSFGSSFSGLMAGGVAAFGSLVGVAGGISALGMGVKLAADAEQSQVAFEVMLGSAGQAKTMIAELKAYSDKSPFDIAGTQEAAKKLLNYGVSAGDVLPTIKKLGDVAAGDKDKFDYLATAFGQMSATGRLMGQDLLQFINAGFNPLQEIAKKTGESMGDLKKRMEGGGISAREVAGAFDSATSQGGKFFGMTERQSGTLAGKFSTMKDAVATSLRTIGEELVQQLNLNDVVDNMTSALEYFPQYASEVISAVGEGFVWLRDTADAALIAIGESIGVNLDLSTAIAGVGEAVESVPFFFRNATPLVESSVIGWNLALFELVPGTADIMGQVGTYFIATWDGIYASFLPFIQNIMDGFKEIGNIATAVWAGIKSGFTNLSFKDAFNTALETFANQDQSTSEHFTTAFGKAFSETAANATEGIADQGGYAQILKDRQASLVEGIAQSEQKHTEELAAKMAEKVSTEALPAGEGFNADVVSKKTTKATRESKNKVAFAGSQEAANALSRGMNGKTDKTEELLNKQLEESKKQTTALETIAGESSDSGKDVS